MIDAPQEQITGVDPSSDEVPAPGPPESQDPVSGPESDAPGSDLSPAVYVVRAALIVLATATLSFALFLTLLSGIKHQAAQTRQYNKFRTALALGTAPVGQTSADGKHLLALGTPVADLRIPSIRLHEVVGEGTTAQVLTMGPGHLRDTPLPGQPGISVIFGRAAAYGGPFKHIKDLHPGEKITVATGVGQATFKVVDVREAGDKVPRLPGNGSRLVLVTARGTAFIPSGLLYVDADLTSSPLAPSPMVLGSGDLHASEQANATDSSSLWEVVLCLEALLVLAVGMVWSWVRWGRYQTWIAFVPPLFLVALLLSDQLTRLLPNLM